MIQWLVNPLFLFLLVWGVATALYAGGVYAGLFPSPTVLTVGAVLLNVVTFSLGYLTWVLFHGLDRTPVDLVPSAGWSLKSDSLVRALRLTLAMGVVALALEMYRIVVIAQYFETTWHHLVTDPELFRIRLVTFISDTIFQTSGTVMLLSITNGLFSIGFVLLGVFLHLDRTGRKYLYLTAFLAVSLFIGLIHLSRSEATTHILYLVFAYCFAYSLDRDQETKSNEFGTRADRSGSFWNLLLPIASLVLLFVLIDILLRKSSAYDHVNRLQGFLFHLFWYLASPLAAFNEFTSTFSGDYQWGQSMFFPLYKWLCRLGLAQETEIYFYGEMVFIPYGTNVYTYLRNFYEDFGILGVAIAPYLLGWATAAVSAQARRHFQFLNLYVILLSFIVFSFFNYFLTSNQIYLQAFFGFLLFRYDLRARTSHTGVSLDSLGNPRASHVGDTGDRVSFGRQLSPEL